MSTTNRCKHILLAIRIALANSRLRKCVREAEHHRAVALRIQGKDLPTLSLQLANLRLQQRQLREPARPVLGQIKRKPALKAVA